MTALMTPCSIQQPINVLKDFFLNEGYLLIKNLFSKEKILRARYIILQELLKQKWAFKNGDKYLACEPINRIGSPLFYRCIQALMGEEFLHEFSYDNSLLDLLQNILGETVYAHPRKMVRISYPYAMNPLDLTPAHQDIFYVRGEPDTFTVWIPLGSYARFQGGLEVYPGSHLRGLYPTRANDEGRFNCTAAEIGLDKLPWCGTDYEYGDVLIMHSLTLHQAIKNETQEFRISLDTRFSSKHGFINEDQLLPPYYPHVENWNSICHEWIFPDRFAVPSTIKIESSEVTLETVLKRHSILNNYVVH